MEANYILRCSEDPKSVLVTGIQSISGCCEDKLELHFGRRSNGGGDVHRVYLVDGNTAVITFEEEEVATLMMESPKDHIVADTKVCVHPAKRKRQILNEKVSSKVSKRYTNSNGDDGQSPSKYPFVAHSPQNGHSFSSWRQTPSFGSQSSGSLSPGEELVDDVYSSDESMEYEEGTHSEKSDDRQNSELNQPVTIQCTANILNYMQAVLYKKLNVIQEKHKVIFNKQNQTTVLVMSDASSGSDILGGVQELRKLIKKLKSETKEEVVTLTHEEADSKNYSNAERELTNSTSLIVRVIGKKFYMYGTLSAINDGKKKLKEMLGSSSSKVSSTKTLPKIPPVNNNSHKSMPHSLHHKDTAKAEVRNNKSSVKVMPKASDNQCKIPPVNNNSHKSMPHSLHHKDTAKAEVRNNKSSVKVMPKASDNQCKNSAVHLKQNSQPKDTMRVVSNQPISVTGSKEVFNYIQVVHFRDLDRMQRKHKAIFELKNGKVQVKPNGSYDVKCVQEATKELKNLMKTVESTTENEVVTLTTEEAESKNYFLAEKEFRESTSLYATVIGKDFHMYGTRPAIEEAKLKLKQMLGTLSNSRASTKPLSGAPSGSNISLNSTVMNRNLLHKDKARETVTNQMHSSFSTNATSRKSTTNTGISNSHKTLPAKHNSHQSTTKETVSSRLFGSSNGIVPSETLSPQTSSNIAAYSGRSTVNMQPTSHVKDDTRLVAKGVNSNQGHEGSPSMTSLRPALSSNNGDKKPQKMAVKPKRRSQDTQFKGFAGINPMLPLASDDHKHNHNDWGNHVSQNGYDINPVDVFETTIQNVKVIGRKGNIINEFANVIVCSANNKLQCNRGIAAEVSKRCGPTIQLQCEKWIRNHGFVNYGDVVWINIDDGIACSHMINAVVPHWQGHGNGTEEVLLQMFMKIFTAARDKLFAHSIVLPLLGTASFGIPRSIFTKTFAKALITFLALPTLPLEEIRIVDFDERSIRMIERELHQMNNQTSLAYSEPTPSVASYSPYGFNGLPSYQDFGGAADITMPSGGSTQDLAYSEHNPYGFNSLAYQDFYSGGADNTMMRSGGSTEKEQCPVCWGSLKNKKSPLHCSHACCGNCFRELEKNNQHCPVCRGPLK